MLRGPTRYGFFCFSFDFLLFFFIVFPLSFLLSSLDFRMLVTSLCGNASAPFTGFL